MVSDPEGLPDCLRSRADGYSGIYRGKLHKTFDTGVLRGLVGREMAGPHQGHEPHAYCARLANFGS